jgi:hypothetical protein
MAGFGFNAEFAYVSGDVSKSGRSLNVPPLHALASRVTGVAAQDRPGAQGMVDI